MIRLCIAVTVALTVVAAGVYGQDITKDVADILALDRDAYYQHILDDFKKLNDEEIVAVTKAVRDRRATFHGDSKLGIIYGAFEDYYKSIGPQNGAQFQQMIIGYIQQHPDMITPRVMLVRALISDAWRSRGDGAANTVSKEGWAGFEKNLKAAKKYAQDALALDEKDPELYTELITITRALNGSEEDMFDYAKHGLELDPMYLTVPSTFANFMLPRWGAADTAEKRVAEFCADNTKDAVGDSLYFYIARCVSDMDGPWSVIKAQHFDWPRLKKAYADYGVHFIHNSRLDNMMACFACAAGAGRGGPCWKAAGPRRR